MVHGDLTRPWPEARRIVRCLSMIPQADMTSEAHMSPQADIMILQAHVISQADIISQAATRTRLTRPCVCFYLLPHDSTAWHDFRSSHESTG